MEMAKLGGRLSRAGSGSTVRNLKSAAVRINLTCTRVRVSPAQGKRRRQPNHRITIHHQRQKDVSAWIVRYAGRVVMIPPLVT